MAGPEDPTLNQPVPNPAYQAVQRALEKIGPRAKQAAGYLSLPSLLRPALMPKLMQPPPAAGVSQARGEATLPPSQRTDAEIFRQGGNNPNIGMQSHLYCWMKQHEGGNSALNNNVYRCDWDYAGCQPEDSWPR